MNKRSPLSRRAFLRLGLGAAAAGVALSDRDLLLRRQERVAQAAILPQNLVRYHLAGTDGWAGLPTTPAIPPYHPDPLAPENLTTYMFGFADATGLVTPPGGPNPVQALKNQCQTAAPILAFDEQVEYTVRLSNLGLQQRPDLVDSHTIHWHGFRNAIPMFDGEPSSSVSVPIGRTLDYYYRPRDPGTYMYHCHFEDTEHVQMGMTGALFVRPAQNQGVGAIPAGRYVYNDGVPRTHPASTAYDREFVMFLSEVWAEAHWADAHIQLPEWSDYVADFHLLNGRVYPDTLLPNWPRSLADGSFNPGSRLDLAYQPISSLVRANAGERVLLRFINLGYTKQSMTLGGVKMRVVGKDATLLRGRTGTDLSYLTNTVMIGPGESVDAIFTAPARTGAGYDTYLLYNRALNQLTNGGSQLGGQMTEVHVYAPGTLAPQTEPNT